MEYMNMNKLIKILCLLCLFSCKISISAEQSPEAKGLEIAREGNKRGDGFVDLTANMKMILKHGLKN